MYTQRPPDDEGGGHTMYRDKAPSHMFHKICTYQRDATTLYSRTIDRVQARIQDLREEGFIANTKINAKCGQLARKDCVERIHLLLLVYTNRNVAVYMEK